jgi:hypothetical protein
MSDLSNDTKKHTSKSRETIPLKPLAGLWILTDFNPDPYPAFTLNPEPDLYPQSHGTWIHCGSGSTKSLSSTIFPKFLKLKFKVQKYRSQYYTGVVLVCTIW